MSDAMGDGAAAGGASVVATCGSGATDGRGEGASALGVTRGVGRAVGMAVACGGGAARIVGTGVGVVAGTAEGAVLGRTMGFCPSIGPCARGAVGVAVGSGKLQVPADWATATPGTTIQAAKSTGLATAASVAREMIMFLPLMTPPPSLNSL
ncbi:MAG TPA: hypothetical protein VMQ93_12955 [Novosphingobium sp.]|nr:hypothetical protein [Novosphingobium sp.]